MHREKKKIGYNVYFLIAVTAIVIAGLLSSAFSPGKSIAVPKIKNISYRDTTYLDTLAEHFKNPPVEYSKRPG